MTKAELIKLIEDSFDGVEQPQDLTLHVAEAHDGYDYDHDDEHRRKDFFGRWQDVPSEDIQNCQTALSYLDKVGMRYYLPAYMVWYLKNCEKTNAVLGDHTLYSLDNHPNDPKLAEYHRERFSLFDEDQMNACAKFVKFCAEDKSGFTDSNFARKKFERYWSQYERNQESTFNSD